MIVYVLKHYSPRKAFLWLISVFFLMFFGRLAYGYFFSESIVQERDGFDVLFDFEGAENALILRKNYASEKIKQTGPVQPPPGTNQSQKYEKIANIRAKSAQFERDEAKIKSCIKQFDAVVQYEQNAGNTGERSLQLVIGVKPERFDSFYVEAQRVGAVLSKSITKTDKTNEYLELNAKRISLEKTRDALLELKKRGGRIDEFIGLENRLLELESELQELGVQLGDYDETNEFCTVRFSLSEKEDSNIGFAQRAKIALEWALKYWCFLMLGLLFAAVAALVMLRIVETFRSPHP